MSKYKKYIILFFVSGALIGSIVFAKAQYVGLQESNGIPHTRSCAIQIAADEVEIRSLTVYEQFAEVG